MDTYNYILIHNLEPKLIEYLKQFDSRIRNIKMIGKFLHVDIGLAKTLPITMMGDGLAHNIGRLATMLRSDTKVILLDQLEDGLHHTAPEPLLKAILELAQKENKQVFITTHSIEMLQKFKAVLDEQKNMQDKFCLYALQRDRKDDVKSYRYSYSQLKPAFATVGRFAKLITIYTEGKADKKFIEDLCKHIKPNKGIRVKASEGISDLLRYSAQNIKQDAEKSSVAVIVDANNDITDRKKELNKLQKNRGLNSPIFYCLITKIRKFGNTFVGCVQRPAPV